jgi:hypothetical protein
VFELYYRNYYIKSYQWWFKKYGLIVINLEILSLASECEDEWEISRHVLIRILYKSSVAPILSASSNSVLPSCTESVVEHSEHIPIHDCTLDHSFVFILHYSFCCTTNGAFPVTRSQLHCLTSTHLGMNVNSILLCISWESNTRRSFLFVVWLWRIGSRRVADLQ